MNQRQRKRYKDKLNGICSGIVRVRAGGVCECCKCQKGVDQHHLNGKDTNALWFYVPGISHVCRYCHGWLHKNPAKNREFAIKLRGQAVYNECIRLKNKTGMKLSEVEEMLKKEKND